MYARTTWLAGLWALVCAATTASAQEPLTAQRVLELSAEAPAVHHAESRVAEARARLSGADLWSERNPSLSAEAGPRLSDRTTLDTGLSLDVPVELWGQRDRRVDAARAEITREEHAAADIRRRVAEEALAAFYRALHARDTVRTAAEQEALARELVAVAEERHQAGDVPLLHLKLARAASEVRASEQREADLRTALAELVAWPEVLEAPLDGDLGDRPWADAVPAGAAVADRPDLRAARAEVAQVRAELALADLERLPETSFSLGYAREEGADIATAGLSVSLPFFNRGQGRRAALAAQLRGARLAEESTRATAEAQVEGARRAYRAAAAALASLEAEGLPLQAENAHLAAEAYRAGKLDLASLLLIRRDSLDLQRDVLDRRLDASLAELELAVASAALPVPDPTVPDEGDPIREGE